MLYQMSRSKRKTTYKINNSVRQTLQAHEPFTVIYNLSSKHDIKTAIETLLLNNELSNSSSIFMVVPASDDEDDDNFSGSFNSTIGIQLSENYTRREKSYNSESDMRLRRPTCHLKPSERESQMFELVLNAEDQSDSPPPKNRTNKLCQITTPYEVTNKLCQMTTPCQVTNKLCQVTAPDGDIKRPYHMATFDDSRHKNCRETGFSRNTIDKQFNYNKLCQVQIPAEAIYQQTYVVGTDTTIDRPCCCKLEKTENIIVEKPCCCVDTYFTESFRNCTKRIVTTESHLISPVLVKTDFSTEDFNISNQSSFLQPSNIPFSSISASLISPETEDFDTGAIFEIDRRCVYNTPVPELEGNQELTIQSCQCTPEKLRRLLEQVLAEKSLNKMSVCCGSPMEISKVPKRTRFNGIKCSACLRTTRKTGSNTCGSNPSFDCECDKLSHITGQPLQNIATSTLFCLDEMVNIGVQGTTLSRDSGQPKPLDLYGQRRRINGNEGPPVVKARGTYTEAGKKRRHSTVGATDTEYKHVGTDVVKRKNSLEYLPLNPLNQYEHMSVSSKNKDQITSNLIQTMSGFEYPLNQPSPKPMLNVGTNIVERQMNTEHPPLRPIPYYDDISMCSKTNDQFKSNLIRTLLGFKYLQAQPSYPKKPKPKVTFEDFLKYYANMNTTLAHGLSPPGIKKPVTHFCEMKKKIKTAPEEVLYKVLYKSPENSKDQNVKEDKGLKLSMSGKT